MPAAFRVTFVPDPSGNTWRVRFSPAFGSVPVRGLDAEGMCSGLRPDFHYLDAAMLKKRCGYRKRLLDSGAIEVTVSGGSAADIVRDWVAALLAPRTG
jgi:hypothetical protein